MDGYKFSVSICVYAKDNAQHFDTALQSIFNQTLPPDEVVLVVDGPVGEDIEAVIRKYEITYNTFRIIRSQQNVGHGNARRLGLKNCTYNLIALMDADDISVSKRFEKQVNVFKSNNHLSIVGGQITEFVDEPNNVMGMRTVPEKDSEIKDYMKKRCPMNHVSVMFKKQDIYDVGGYIDWFCNEDYYLWIRMALANKIFYNLADTLIYVRVGADMYKRRGGIKYFKSEAKLQLFMLRNKLIALPRFVINVAQRLIVQVLMPNSLRGWVFKKFARSKN